jgi:hypothetical protein
MAPFRLTRKMNRSLLNNFPTGSAGTFRGPDADWSQGDRGLFVVVELAEGRPDDLISQLVEVGFDGANAGPVQVGSSDDARAGVQRFTIGGHFHDGSETAGTTDISGHAPGDRIELYNASSRIFGTYDRRADRYLLLLPERRDARNLAVTLRSVTDAGEVIDRLELPGGGHLVPLEDPALGFKPGDGAIPLGCRAIATRSGTVSADDGVGSTTTIVYTAGVGRDAETGEMADPDDTFAALEGLDTVPIRLERLDSEEEPLIVEAPVTMSPAMGTFSVLIDVPPGQWTFRPEDPEALVTPAGEALIHHATLTGRAGIRTGEGLDGFVIGAPDCGRWDLGVATACELVPGDGLAALLPTGGNTLEQVDIAAPDGSAWCIGRIPDTTSDLYRVRVGRDVATSADIQAAADESGCSSTPVEVGADGLLLDCADQGSFERYVFVVVPQATVAQDPDGGVLVTLEMAVDASRPVGERYDSAAALEAVGTIADRLAASAGPGGAGEASQVP